jgi:hypothetical protein
VSDADKVDGGQAHNTFTITHLLIPKQEGTTDTCTTTHEEEQFAYQDERDLMTLGWVRPSPSLRPLNVELTSASRLPADPHPSDSILLHELTRPAHPRELPGHARRGHRDRLRAEPRPKLWYLPVRSLLVLSRAQFTDLPRAT